MNPAERDVLTRSVLMIQQGGRDRDEALSKVFDLLWRRYVARFRAAGLDSHVAEDLAGELFLKFIEKVHQIRGAIAAESWLNTLSYNVMRDHFREIARRSEVSQDDEADKEALFDAVLNRFPVIDQMRRSCLSQQIELFSIANPERAYVLCMCAENDFSPAELGKAIDRTAGAAKVYLHECRKRLREFIRQCLE